MKDSALAESIDIKMSFGRLLHWMLVFAQGRYLCRDILQLILSGLLVGIIWQARKEELVAMAGDKNASPWYSQATIIDEKLVPIPSKMVNGIAKL